MSHLIIKTASVSVSGDTGQDQVCLQGLDKLKGLAGRGLYWLNESKANIDWTVIGRIRLCHSV